MSCNNCGNNANMAQHRNMQMQRGQYQKQRSHYDKSMQNTMSNRMNGNMGQGNMTRNSYCSCNDCMPANEPVDKMMIAMAYVPWQPWGELFDYDVAFEKGTVFMDLDKPWMGRSCDC